MEINDRHNYRRGMPEISGTLADDLCARVLHSHLRSFHSIFALALLCENSSEINFHKFVCGLRSLEPRVKRVCARNGMDAIRAAAAAAMCRRLKWKPSSIIGSSAARDPLASSFWVVFFFFFFKNSKCRITSERLRRPRNDFYRLLITKMVGTEWMQSKRNESIVNWGRKKKME